MKRFLLLGGLLVANLIAFGVWSGWLDPWLPGKTEPQRLASQVAPDQVKVVPLAAAASKEAPPSPAAASVNGADTERGSGESATTSAVNASGGSAPATAAPAVAAPAAQASPGPAPAVPAPAVPAPAVAAPAPAAAAALSGKPSGPAGAPAAPTVSPPSPTVASSKAVPPVAALPQAPAPQVAAPKAAAPSTPSVTAPTSPAPPPPVPAPPAVQSTASAPAVRDTAAASVVCVAAGPLDEARAERTRAWTRKLAAGLQGKVERRPESTSYMVYVPASRTQADAQRRFDQLRQSGLTDIFLITEGSLRLAISLGIFRSQEGARAQIETLAARGLDNLRIASIPGRNDRVWATLTRTASVAEGPWDAARAQLKELAGVVPSACTP